MNQAHHRHGKKHLQKRQQHIHIRLVLLVVGLATFLGIISGVAVLFSMRLTQPAVGVDVRSTSFDEKGTDSFRPGNGYTFVIVDFSVANQSNQIFNFAPVIQTYLTDSHNMRYDMSPAIVDTPIIAGPIAPGITRSGKLTYSVPKTATDLTFHFTATGNLPLQYSRVIR